VNFAPGHLINFINVILVGVSWGQNTSSHSSNLTLSILALPYYVQKQGRAFLYINYIVGGDFLGRIQNRKEQKLYRNEQLSSLGRRILTTFDYIGSGKIGLLVVLYFPDISRKEMEL
jgi:hypothetical protein